MYGSVRYIIRMDMTNIKNSNIYYILRKFSLTMMYTYILIFQIKFYKSFYYIHLKHGIILFTKNNVPPDIRFTQITPALSTLLQFLHTHTLVCIVSSQYVYHVFIKIKKLYHFNPFIIFGSYLPR